MSHEWPVAPIAGPDQSSCSSSHEDPNDEHPESAFLLFHIHVGGGMVFNDLKYNEVAWMGTHVSIFVLAVLHELLGT